MSLTTRDRHWGITNTGPPAGTEGNSGYHRRCQAPVAQAGMSRQLLREFAALSKDVRQVESWATQDAEEAEQKAQEASRKLLKRIADSQLQPDDLDVGQHKSDQVHAEQIAQACRRIRQDDRMSD